MQEKSLALTQQVSLSAKIQDYVQLTKLRLSSLVVFSAAMGYVIATNGHFSWSNFLLLMLGGFLVTGASNAFNQIIEKDLDKLMTRTENRPLPTGRMSVTEATLAAFLMGISGVMILWLKMNPLCGILSLLSLLLYAVVYTPAKRITSFSVLIGAIPGAFPPLLGWIAAKNEIGLEGLGWEHLGNPFEDCLEGLVAAQYVPVGVIFVVEVFFSFGLTEDLMQVDQIRG
jgi:protoheme IX farnesyltransferase